MIVILMGVSGCGKTTIGQVLSRKLGWPLLDADEFHSAASIEKMRNGIALDDADRKRLEARKGHYMKAGLLESQFAALEEPEDALRVDIDDSPDSIADLILRRLRAMPARKTGSDK